MDEPTAKLAEKYTVEVKGKRYFTGETARIQVGMGASAGLSQGWTESNECLALVASAMKRFAALGATGLADTHIVIGRPAALVRLLRPPARPEDVGEAKHSRRDCIASMCKSAFGQRKAEVTQCILVLEELLSSDVWVRQRDYVRM